jgi:two-component system, LytTR family, response regulator
MLKTIIIDDEQHCADVLKAMLEQKFSDTIKLEAVANNADEGRVLIKHMKPDLVFLDVEMPVQTGIDLLASLDKINFEIIFTTAHEQYALRAIKLNALDYLLKPFSIEELEAAIEKCKAKKLQALNPENLQSLMGNLKNTAPDNKKIGLAASGGTRYVPIKEIVRIEADSNYSTVFFTNNTKLVLAKTLKDFDELLSPYNFFRVHNSHLINLSELQQFTNRDGDHVVMNDGSKVEVSRRRKSELLEALKKI